LYDKVKGRTYNVPTDAEYYNYYQNGNTGTMHSAHASYSSYSTGYEANAYDANAHDSYAPPPPPPFDDTSLPAPPPPLPDFSQSFEMPADNYTYQADFPKEYDDSQYDTNNPSIDIIANEGTYEVITDTNTAPEDIPPPPPPPPY